jgi:uncharacterized protein (DUF4415 family)
MKHATTSRTFTAEQISAAIESAPLEVPGPDCAYDPNDPKAVADYFRGAVVVRGGGVAAVRKALAASRADPSRIGVNAVGGGASPRTSRAAQATKITLSPEVFSAFRATGDGWQARVDGALRDWLKEHEPATVKLGSGS